MSATTLYRKYRPATFEDVVGQEAVVSALSGAIKNDAIAHAYLFSGSRGTGKTSLARILARAVGASQNDTYEIDAASNRGVDDIRVLREAVHTLPFDSQYKVYIIDEAHMLTKEAFNALLKTLEEPPRHVIFILATTEEGKLPETIVSRCQTFRFKTPPYATLKNVVENVARKEGFTLDPSSADLIALLGDGSFRDTLGILQKVIASSSDKKISHQEVETIVGAPPGTLVNDFITAIAERDAEKGFVALLGAERAATDMNIFLNLVLRKMRFVLLLRFAPAMRKEIERDVAGEDLLFLEKLTKEAISTVSSREVAELLNVYRDLRVAAIPVLPLELVLMRIVGHTTGSGEPASGRVGK